MKIISDFEINFIRIIHKNPNAITRSEKNINKQRLNYIKEQFEFTTEVYKKLIHLNEQLRQEEKRILCQYRQIEKKCDLMVTKKEIDSYNLEVVVNYYNNNHYSKYDPSFENKPFFETGREGDFMEYSQKRIQFDTICWNTLYDGHKGIILRNSPLSEIDHCFSFHHLYDHTDLTWFDIHNIDEINMEIKVDYQFIGKIK
jgi:hypothetical protein